MKDRQAGILKRGGINKAPSSPRPLTPPAGQSGGKRLYILYDGRACGAQGADDAMVLVSCETEKQAKSYKGDYGSMACYSYAIRTGNQLEDERWEWDYPSEGNL